ncbi:hypothetical protein SprV_0401573900 [Sparganum proliferum]
MSCRATKLFVDTVSSEHTVTIACACVLLEGSRDARWPIKSLNTTFRVYKVFWLDTSHSRFLAPLSGVVPVIVTRLFFRRTAHK